VSTETETNLILDELVARGIVAEKTASDALGRSRMERKPVLRILVEDQVVSEETIYEVVADAAGMAFIAPEQLDVDPTASSRLPGDWARRLRALPYGWEGNNLIIAVDDPTNIQVADDLRRITKADPQLSLAAPANLMRKIGTVYRAEEELEDLAEVIGDTASAAPDENEISGDGSSGEAPIVRFVNLLIAQAVADRASDIHLEPTETELQVRYRIDGVLHPQRASSRSFAPSIASRVKIMANMDIAERRVPQDGRMTVAIGGRNIDVRVTTLPIVYGEKVVLRILDNSAAPLSLLDVGFSDYHREIYSKYYRRPYGMILVTGPTGSGKSTSLYATLNTIRSPQTNVITVEDPVEYRMPGVNQVQINNKAGLSFATALRSILRADPDILLVGEVRDRETAQIAIEASLTGHLVLASLHTNDAASAVTRLVEMGIEPFLVGSAVNLVVAQRLLRRLCERCSVTYTATPDQMIGSGFPWAPGEDLPTLRKSVGCDFCSRTGYRGRTAIHEMFEITADIEKLVNEGANSDELREAAVKFNGMRPMRMDGWEKVREGITTIEEVLRVSAS
jgi:type IV pilus assembly protein PilB